MGLTACFFCGIFALPVSNQSRSGGTKMALTNAEKQTAHRARQAQTPGNMAAVIERQSAVGSGPASRISLRSCRRNSGEACDGTEDARTQAEGEMKHAKIEVYRRIAVMIKAAYSPARPRAKIQRRAARKSGYFRCARARKTRCGFRAGAGNGGRRAADGDPLRGGPSWLRGLSTTKPKSQKHKSRGNDK